MYRILFILFLLHCFGTSSAQIAIQLDKMNAVYIGIANPLSIADQDIPAARLQVQASQGQLTKKSAEHYQWTICTYDTSVAWLIFTDSLTGQPIDTQYFRVKNIPEPKFEVVLGANNTTVHRNRGVVALLQNFDFNTLCNMMSFTFTFFPQKGDPYPDIINEGARFNSSISDLLNRAVPGDRLRFANFKYTCGCDEMLRKSDQVLYFTLK